MQSIRRPETLFVPFFVFVHSQKPSKTAENYSYDQYLHEKNLLSFKPLGAWRLVGHSAGHLLRGKEEGRMKK
jgi:hypothetical protein